MLHQYLELAEKIGRKTCPRKGDEDDYIGVAYLALCQAQKLLETKPTQDEPIRFIAKTIKGYCLNFFHENNLIRIPHGSKARNNLSDLKCFSFRRRYTRSGEDDDFEDYSDIPAVRDYHIKDDIEDLAKTQLEKQVLKLRLRSYTDQEIGVLLGFSGTTIWKARQRIIDQYLENVNATT